MSSAPDPTPVPRRTPGPDRGPDRPAGETVGPFDSQILAVSVHAGHDLRPEVAAAMVLPEDIRLREEDPGTDELASAVPSRILTHRSRFEVDLNRTLVDAVYREPSDSWGLDVWSDPPLDAEIAERSRAIAEGFYGRLGAILDEVAARGPFVVLDVHSYNHRRSGADAEPLAQAEAPDINVGTGSLNREVFGGVVDTFLESMSAQRVAGRPLDARENVVFEGREVAQYVHDRYPGRGCVLALEFKKTFMDEWTGEVDRAHLAELRAALAATVDPVLAALSRVPAPGAAA